MYLGGGVEVCGDILLDFGARRGVLTVSGDAIRLQWAEVGFCGVFAHLYPQ